MTQNIEKNLMDLHHEIHDYEKKFARPLNSVSLLAVSKHQPIEKIQEAINAGQLAFGENYLQEALTKIASLNNKDIIWHFIGPIQSNKTKKIAAHFDWVQSVSSPLIAKKLNDHRPIHLPPLNICLQVNISKEQTKSGLHLNEVPALLEYCSSLPRLRLRGLMAIPAPHSTFMEQTKSFHPLRLLFEEILYKYPNLDTLSIGMSDDLSAAIAEGSTMIRIGTRIFGKRKSNH
jgi:pyridoxal phosphate enzyme (YggS family)